MDEIKILKTRLQLAKNQTIFERQKRQLHARRNRHLLGRVVKALALEESNCAMKDQLSLQEEEMTKLRNSLVRSKVNSGLFLMLPDSRALQGFPRCQSQK